MSSYIREIYIFEEKTFVYKLSQIYVMFVSCYILHSSIFNISILFHKQSFYSQNIFF